MYNRLITPPCHHRTVSVLTRQTWSSTSSSFRRRLLVGFASFSSYISICCSGDLGVLDDTDLGGAHGAAVELPSLALGVHNGVILLSWAWCHEHGLVLVGVKLIEQFWIDSLQSMLLQRGHEDTLSHLQALIQVDEILNVLLVLLLGELLVWDHAERAVEIVHGFDEVLGEFLECEVLCGLDFALGALLEVAEVGDGAHILVLEFLSASVPYLVPSCLGGELDDSFASKPMVDQWAVAMVHTFNSTTSFCLASNSFLILSASPFSSVLVSSALASPSVA